MGLTHIRTPKNFVLEERLKRYGAAIEERPETFRGHWAQACWPLSVSTDHVTATGTAPVIKNGTSHAAGASDNHAAGASDNHAAGASDGRALGNDDCTSWERARSFSAVHLDLGCGKGAYLIERARREPNSLLIGMDTEPICVAYAAQYICEAELPNALVLPRGADSLARIFAPGELAAITLNFPTPYPKRKFAERRLVHVNHLLSYRNLLASGATVTLRTDSQPLRDYALTQFEAAGYRTLWTSDNVRAEHPEHPVTEYERRLAAQGAPVYGICATPAATPSPAQIERGLSAEQSLVAYLPHDLDAMGYVPLGMEGAVINLRNRARNASRSASREHR